MVHLHSLLSSDATSTTGQVATLQSTKSGRDGFRDVLSQAGGAGEEHAAARESATPVSRDGAVRVAPPPPTTSPVSSGNAGSASTGATESDYDPFLVDATSAPANASNASTAAASNTPAVSTTLTAQQSFDDAYWASQPAAVQALRDAPGDQRLQMATQLAQEGYSIDVPIMVWGWDPYTTTNERIADGYTWMPSALQSPIAVAPGLNFNGESYNPNDPPAGSIAV